ncbi:hypothetical protein AL073_03230 [Loktanella sp. 1ANDIMAR09]|nr:hypothetical protein AL073_03230 [Loktanella sp. 1ANDIMAR09]
MPYHQVTGEIASLEAFINAALREDKLTDPSCLDGRLVFTDHDGAKVVLGLVRHSSDLRLRFDGSVTRDLNGAVSTMTPTALLQHLSAPGGKVFQNRVMNSINATIAAPLRRGTPENWTFIAAEQALKAGHPMHPTPRSRDEMTHEAAQRYAPEHEGRFALEWYAVDRDNMQLGGEDAQTRFAMLAKADLDQSHDGCLIPLHPWQATQLAADPRIATMIDNGTIRHLGAGRPAWAATSSMRSLYASHAPFMVKTSLSLRLTNSVRHLSLREVRRGLHISSLLLSPLGTKMRQECPTLNILGEPGYAAIIDEGGILCPETIAVLRDNPFDGTSRGPVLLAALCEAAGNDVSPLGELVQRLGHNAGPRWFARFLDVAVYPVLEVRARHGLLFGSHQQNMMVGLNDGWPANVWVRDCQGTGHLESFHDHLTAFCPDVGEGTENIVPAEMGDGLLTYYVVVNTVMHTLATLVLDGAASEPELIDIWRNALRRWQRETPGDATLYTRLLERPGLTCKGNFSTSISGVNEADGDAGGQLATFLEIPNPVLERQPA